MSRRHTTTRTTEPRRRTTAIGAAAAVVGGAGSALLLSLTAAPAPATVSGTFTVDTLDDGFANAADCTTPVAGSCSLRDALDAALPGDTVVFDPSLFVSGPRTITLDGSQLFDDGADITGPGSHLLTIDANGNSRVLEVESEVTGTTISGVTVTGGSTSSRGAGIKDSAYNLLVLDDVVVTENSALAVGVAGVAAGSLRLLDSVVSDNEAIGSVGGVYVTGDTYVDGSTISGNSSTGCAGGFYFGASGATLTILDSTFSDNSTTGCYGGALDIDGNDNTVTIANSTFTGNSAPVGGAIHVDFGNDVRIAMTTITGNTATNDDPFYSGGGIHVNPGDVAAGSLSVPGKRVSVATRAWPTLDLVGVILAGNHATGDGVADLSQGFPTQHDQSLTVPAASSFVGTVSTNVVLTGSGLLRGSDPQLGPLADNGGTTQTMLPLAGSPVLDAGPATIPEFPGNAFDQRGSGYPRTSGPASDIGAVEVTVPPEPTFTG